MEKEIVEIPQTDIPDEVRQVDLPEIGVTTPHPKPESPLASDGGEQVAGERVTGDTAGPIGFLP